MPYKSEAQRKFFNSETGKKIIGEKEVEKWNKESKGMKLPEKVEDSLIVKPFYKGKDFLGYSLYDTYAKKFKNGSKIYSSKEEASKKLDEIIKKQNIKDYETVEDGYVTKENPDGTITLKPGDFTHFVSKKGTKYYVHNVGGKLMVSKPESIQLGLSQQGATREIKNKIKISDTRVKDAVRFTVRKITPHYGETAYAIYDNERKGFKGIGGKIVYFKTKEEAKKKLDEILKKENIKNQDAKTTDDDMLAGWLNRLSDDARSSAKMAKADKFAKHHMDNLENQVKFIKNQTENYRNTYSKDKLVEVPDKDLKMFESALNREGFKIESKRKYGSPASTHYQVKYKFKAYSKEELRLIAIHLDRICDIADKLAPTTYNVGYDKDGNVTAGIDVREMYVKDNKTTDSYYSVSYKKNGVYQSIGVYANSEAEAKKKFEKHKPEAEFIGASLGSEHTDKMKGKPMIKDSLKIADATHYLNEGKTLKEVLSNRFVNPDALYNSSGKRIATLPKMDKKVMKEFGDRIVKKLEVSSGVQYVYLEDTKATDSMPQTYTFTVKQGTNMKKVEVSAKTYEEALKKVKSEAIKYKGSKVFSKFDNNKLNTRDSK